MIGILDDNNTTRLSVSFNGLDINSLTVNSSGARSERYGYTVETAAPRTGADYVSEPNQWNDQMEVYGLRKVSRIWTIRGFVYGRDISDLMDRAKALAAATDPARIKFQNPTSWSEMPLTFSTPTRDTANFASGLVASKILCFPLRMAEPPVSVAASGLGAPYQLDLLLKEPRRFYQTVTTVSDSATSNNSLADDVSWPTVTFTLSGAGHASFTIANTGTYQGAVSLVLDLSAHSSGSWTVNFRERTIHKDGTLTQGVYKSGTWWMIEPGNNVIAYSNTTNTSSRSLTYYPAWCL